MANSNNQRGNDNGNGRGDKRRGRNNGGNQERNSNLNRSKPIKAELTDSNGKTVKEPAPCYSDGDPKPKEGLIQLASRVEHFGDRYKMFEDGKWEVLLQISGRAIQGRCEKQWT